MKNISYHYIKTCLIICTALTLYSCEKNYLDVNTDPNHPSEVQVRQLLPSAIAQTAYVLGNEYQILGGYWAQFWTQGPTGSQYFVYDQYLVVNTTFDRPWTDLYNSALEDYKNIIQLSESGKSGNAKYAGIAYIMQAYTYQLLTDLHGDIPFSEALKGDEGIYTPHYDSQKDIYDGLIKLVDKGIEAITSYTGDDTAPDEDDLIYGGDTDEWIKFANTLKLKIYMRQSAIRPGIAQTNISAMVSSGAEFLSAGEDAEMQFFDATFNQNPFYGQIASLGSFNILASNTALLYLWENNDPRIDVIYRHATSGDSAGTHRGITQGEGKLPGYGGPTVVSGWFSKPSFVVEGPASPVVFMSAAESNFLQSEAAARGWTSADAQTLYEDGIKASFTRWGFSETDASDYYAQDSIAFPVAGTVDEKIKSIITQKWISMDGTENAEAWTEQRRTGYPVLQPSVTSQIGGNNLPAILPYPNSEQTLNPNTPPQHLVTDHVWWDVN